MSVKLIMTWDIAPDRDQDYFEFVINEFVPGAQHMGLQPTEAWVTVYGEHPQIQVSIVSDDLQTAQRIIHSENWVKLQEKLLTLVQNFSYKIVPARNSFQF